MDGWDFFIPSIGLFISLNLITCCLGVRRMRMLERRVWVLENTTTNTPLQANTSTQSQTQTPSYTYVQPPIYTYYQQPTAPASTQYYSQDPTVVQTGRTY